MSTFLLKMSGNLVVRSARASPPVLSAADIFNRRWRMKSAMWEEKGTSSEGREEDVE
jgi:hypothetical protein